MRPPWPLAFALLLTALTTPTLGQSQNGSPEIQALLAADQAWVNAFTTCDVQGMDRLVGQDLEFINVGGSLIDKGALLKIVASCPIEDGMREFVTARVLGDNVGNVISRFRYHLKNQPAPRWWLSNRTYIKRKGAWQLVSASHTLTKPPEAPK
jgi:hypothetical protein